MNSIKSQIISAYLHELLNVDNFKDYCPNGLQIEGKSEVKHIVCGVTINQALIEAAINAQADGIIVHHGIFWKGDDYCISSIKKQRIKTLLKYDLNLWAYHLPLDFHEQFGNNAMLAQLFNLNIESKFGDQNLGCIGKPTNLGGSCSLQYLYEKISTVLGKSPLLIGDVSIDKQVKNIAWCSGGAQSYFVDAINKGCDVFISGEISEQYVHIAREHKVCYMVCGHHATERYGVKAIGEHLMHKYGIKYSFIDIDSPI